MDISNLNELEIDQFEYCIIYEDTPLPASTVKVTIPKVTVNISKQTCTANPSILINDSECKPTISGPIKLVDYMTVKTFSGLEMSKSAILEKEECGCKVVDHQLIRDCKGDRYTFIDGHIKSAYLPKGSKMIVCFMNKNVNDGYLTNFL